MRGRGLPYWLVRVSKGSFVRGRGLSSVSHWVKGYSIIPQCKTDKRVSPYMVMK